MSHFTVLVITPPAPVAPTQDELMKVLLPWHEHECTGYTEYCVWVDETEKLLESFAKRDAAEQRDYPTIEVYAEEYYGYQPLPDQPRRFGRFTNPNRKWDWWVVGGRWSAMLHRPRGARADQLRLGELSLQSMQDLAVKNAGELYDKAQRVIRGESYIPWGVLCEKHPGNIEAARTEYAAQPVIQRWRKDHDLTFISPDDFSGPRTDYLERARASAFATFAVVKDGVWYERGSMGWWGMVADEQDQGEWNKRFGELLKELPPDVWLTVVDCHI